MGIIDKLKGITKKTPITLDPTDEQGEQYKYWGSAIKRARKAQPAQDWDDAESRLAAKPTSADPAGDGKPFVNDFRKQQEASGAFLDQQDAGFKVTPTEGWMNDEMALGQSQCDAAYLKRIWVEQKCQKAESRKLNDGLAINNGTTLVQFDVKKWMPYLRYLPQRKVLIDPDCGGLVENADWEGYEDPVSVETFRSWHPDIDEKVFKAIVKRAGSVLTEKENDETDDTIKPMYKVINVVHIFARNSAAIRDEKKAEGDDEKPVSIPLAEELQLTTPRRYMQYVEGWPALLVDEMEWPLDLDHDEFPTTHLQFNQLNNDMYGYTDYRQMEKMDLMGDDMIADLATASFNAAVTKYLGSENQRVDPIQLDNFLNQRRTAALLGMLTADMKPKLVPVQRGQINPSMTQLYELVQDQVKEASSLSETLSNADAQTFKDVTAIAARIADNNMHQRVNRRLGGPWGYEQSIAEDAIKILEVAHQLVPMVSSVAVIEQMPEVDELTGEPMIDEMGQPVLGEEQENVKDLPWEEAKVAIAGGGTLLKLGVDAIVGPQLAQFWPYGTSPKQWKLNIKVIVEPGTTRAVTRQQQAAVMKQLYLEMYQPFYTMIMNYNPVMGMNFMKEFLEFVGRLAQVPDIEQKLPELTQIQQMVQAYMMQMQQAQQQQMQGEQAGEMASPEATGGEVQQ